MRPKKYSDEHIENLFKDFIIKNKREPTYHDFGKNGFPHIKTLQRSFGKLSLLREKLNLYKDHRTGSIRSLKANKINKRAMKYYPVVSQELLKYFPEIAIHKESSITDDRRNRTDFKIFTKNTILFVDLFYPSDMRSFGGCIGSKKKKYPRIKDLICTSEYRIIFVNMNPDLMSSNLKMKSLLPDKMYIRDYKDFLLMCEELK